MAITTIMWIVIGVAAWLAVAAVVGVLIGRAIRARDHQVPRDADGQPTNRMSDQPTRPHGAAPPVTGRGRSRRA